jgi:stage IV sporulation protein B
MNKRLRLQRFRVALAVVLGAACLTPPVQKLADTPSDIYVPLGQGTSIPVGLPGFTHVKNSNEHIVSVSPPTQHHADISVMARDVGNSVVKTTLFGFVPWKALRVHVVPTEMVYVGGQSVGIRLHSKGVLVVGFQRVGKERISPAVKSNLQIGDVIEQINQKTVRTSADLRKFLNECREPVLQLQIRRQHQHFTIQLSPVVDEYGRKHLGIYARDKTAGVGTLTFYDPEHHRFGALGHIITDVDTGQPIEGTGSLYEAEVTGVVKGTAGKPGEKRGRFIHQSDEIGQIDENTPYGVYGKMLENPDHQSVQNAIPVALPGQVHEGPAKMYTVLNGQKVEAFDVEIENVAKQTKPDTKSMVVHVTDDRLIQMSGGIVQGMSGSPLVQDGKLVGAVTHVFVSDPTRGYGVYAAWMLKECEASMGPTVSAFHLNVRQFVKRTPLDTADDSTKSAMAL